MTKHFELKLWVCVSEEFDVKTIVQKITESATKKKVESFLQMDALQSELRKQIDGKKYLLVMDDVWNEDYEKWVSLKRLLMGGAKGSRILITTRGKRVAKTFDTTFYYHLQNLDECNSWILFKKMTVLEGQAEELENSNLVQTGKEIVAKLKGVPLAIRTIGRLLRDKKSQKFWLSFKDKELYQIMGQGKNGDLYMRSIIELSYKHLPANLKLCFLYCALFPKDYEIQKDKLILHWRAQGFIPPNDIDETIDMGEDYFMELLSKSFFQDITKDELGNIEACKMHDLMHDLACSITKNDCFHGLKNDIDKRTHHFSLTSMSCAESKELRETLSKARNLRTFFLLDNCSDSFEMDLGKLFQNNSRLRTLELRLHDMDQTPKIFETFISRFIHLRYLNVSDLDFKDLPKCITELFNLETLILQCFTQLENLPDDIKNLINLKHLDLGRSWSLKFLPDSITELCKLEALILSNCIKLKELPKDVKKWINLRHLDLIDTNIEFLPNSICQLSNLETILLRECSKLKELPEDIKMLINLKHLDTSHCRNLTHMPKEYRCATNLQTLNDFVLGENNGGGLSELNGLNKLHGRLSIKNLEFCNVVDLQMKAKFLQQKSGLQELSLEWNHAYNDEATIENLDDVYERVLDCLWPHSNLQMISIYRYGGTRLCNWLSSGSLGCLVHISLVSCKRLLNLPHLDQFPFLKKLYLDDLPTIKYIGNNHSVSSSTCFPSIEKLCIRSMPKLRILRNGTTSTKFNEHSEGSFSIKFPCLSRLEIFCSPLHILMSFHAPLLESIRIGNLGKGHRIKEVEFDVPWENFKNLSSMWLSELAYLPKCLQRVTTLQCLSLWHCQDLKSLPEWIDNLASLRKLEIHYFKKLTSLPEGIRHVHGLQLLNIVNCPLLKERCRKDTGEDWPKIAHIAKVFLLGKCQ